MRQRQTIIKLMMLLGLIFGSSSSAFAVDYIYNIINNSGELVMRVKDTNGNAKLIATARTPFAKDYRYYKTLAEAQADAQYGRNEAVASHGAIAYDENTSFSTITSSGALEKEGSASLIYVRYSYNPSATTIIDTEGNVLDITGKSSYNLEIEGYKGSKNVALRKCYYYNGLDAAIVWKYSNVVTDDERKSPAYRWFYIGAMAGYEGAQGNPDPYDIKIENAAGRSANHSYVVSGHYDKPMPYTGFGTNQHINCYYSADNANTNNIYRFFIRVVTGSQPNSVQLAAAEPCFIFKSASNSWFVLNSEEDNDTYKPYMHFRLHGNHELGNNATNVRAHCMFTKAKAGHKYVIVGKDGTERARANAPIDEDIELKVPDAISTIVPVTYHYFTSKDNATNYYTNSGGETNEITVLPSTNETIYVSYDYDASQNGLVKLDGSAKYIVAINDRYVKYDATGFQNSHVVEGNKDDAENGNQHVEYIWRTKGEDPYGIFVQNEQAGNGFYFTGTGTSAIEIRTSGEGAAVQATDSYTRHVPGRYFLVKSPLYTETHPLFLFRAVYTSEADDNQYTWGYHATEGCSFLSSSNVDDDADAIQMQIYELRDNQVTYHIIDKQGKEVVSASNNKVYCVVPDEIFSPLVSQYHYYPSTAFTVSDGVYTLSDTSKEITDRMTTGHNDIYVTYDVGTEIDININTNKSENILVGKNHTWKNGQFYLLKFLNGESYYQEDGKDGITDGTHSKASPPINEIRKAEYPYANGDGAMNIYNEEFTEGKLSGGASERTRMPWGITGGDPYRVKIVAYQNSHFLAKNSVATTTGYFSYFRTYYNTTLKKVITNNVLDDPVVKNADVDEVPTEYMILGKKGKYKLVTSDPITDKSDNTTERRTLHTFEQYWKNYETIRGAYLGQTNEERAENTALTEGQIEALKARDWHTYEAWAYARPWDGWDLEGGTNHTGANKAKRMVKEEHWYQTFEVGEEFDLIPVSINPAIVLLDNHGWEVFRRPMTKDAKDLIFIKSYDSKMVKAYHWYKAATKAIGYHKYTVSDPALTEDESEEYTSTSLINYPPNYANHPGDWYVTYEVKDEYKYLYNAEAGKSAPVLIKQNSKWAKATSESAIGAATEDQASIAIDKTDVENVVVTGADKITNDILWYLAPNATIDTEMGYAGEAVTYTADQRCFDPYNVQIRNASNSKYFKTAATDATLENAQHWLATNPYNLGLGESTAAGFSAIGHDNVSMNITNTTFMLIEDAHGNLRFCPRFDHESAVTNLTGGNPQLNSWVYDVDNNNNVIETKTDSVAMQAIELYPLQRYQFHIRDYEKGGTAGDIVTSEEFYAVAGTSLIHQLSNLKAPLPVEYIRGYCEYMGAYTTYNAATNEYSGEVTSYPTGTENGIELTHIYVPYTVVSTAAFFDSEAEAVASNNWMFLLQGTESVATIFGKKLIDYGMEVRYGFRDAAQSEDIGEDMPDLTPAERSFVWNSKKYGGFHFLRRGGTPTVNGNTGTMTFAEGQENVLAAVGNRYFASKNTTASVYLLSPLNDFRRIAETYTDGKETGFRESSWLWAFIGDPYKFYAINREDALSHEEKDRKRLAIGTDNKTLKLTDAYQKGETYDPTVAGAYWFTMSKYAVQTDDEAANTFALQLWDGDLDESNDQCIGKSSSSNEFTKATKNLIKSGTVNQPDIAVMKVSSFRAYPWNWDDKKYQKVTVNIYPGTEENHGPLALTKTYERSDRAFIAGDVIDGTDGHFYLPIEAQEDGSWKPDGVVTNTVPYDHHLINIPYELRRRFCKYTVQGGSYTVELDDSEDPEPQVINIYYTVDTDNAPLFVSEDELESFRNYINADAEGTFKDGKKYSDYFYFLDMEWGMWSHLYANGDKQGGANGNRFAVGNPKQMMWYFVGDPYNVRLFNVYTDLKFSGETRNFVRHRYADMEHHSTGYNNSDNVADDNKTFMENVSNKVFSWEMVDPYVGNSSNNVIAYSGEYSIANNSNAAYRLSQVEDKPFALRMKMVKEETEEIIRDATYYYLGKNGTTEGTHLYNYNGETLYHRLNNQNAFPTYPDNRHSANSANTTITPLKPTKVYVTVYDPDEPTRKVTDNEVSDFFAVTDRFKGVPDNLQRNYCDYWWVSTDPDIKSTNMVDENLYYTIESENSHIYARYRESDNSPFSTLVDGVPVLKRDADANPWYNMNIGNWWAFFNSSLDGKTYPVNNVGGNVLNNSVLSFVYKGSKLNPTYPAEKFRKGLQWALVGDPYNFTIRNNRDIITIENGVATKTDGDYEYNSAYLNQTAIATTGTTWTWLRNATTTDNYFLSESAGRRTEVVASNSSGAKGFGAPRRILPSDYTISAQSETRNFTVVDSNGNSSITTGDNYTTGSKMFLLSVEDESVQNESFDAIVNVYNKMNELVATTGWTELARNNAEWSGEIPTDVQRWGCNYHYWADETMTRYPFNSFSQKDDSGNYLIKDGDVVYVTYDYDESLYSSENEYRWVNLFFNWDNDYKKWEKQTVTGKSYTAEYWEWEENYQKFVKRYEHSVTQSYPQWTETDLYTQTENRWLESPATTTEGSYDKDKAYAYYKNGQYTDATDAKKQKWAMIGDPYRFILYNYNRKAEAGADNSYYLNYSNGDIKSKKLSFDSDHPKDTWQGLYWTWKIDGQRFTFAQGDNIYNTTIWTKLDGLPESFYKNYTAAEATSDVAEKKDGYSIQSGYLALCDMEATSEYDKDQLIGSVSGYATFKHRYLETTQLTNGTGDDAPLTYYTGTQEKFKKYINNGVLITSDFDYTSPNNKVEVLTGTQEETGAPIYEEVPFPEKWRATYANGYEYDDNGIYTKGPYTGYYVGPIESIKNDIYTSHTTYKSVQELKYENVQGTEQYLQLTENLIPQSAEEMPVPRFLVMPMAAHAKSITFHLQTDKYSDDTTPTRSLRSADNIVFDHTSKNYGVGNTLMLPWMMRRQYCDYKFYLVDKGDNILDARKNDGLIDDLTFENEKASNTHRLNSRDDSYSTFWTGGTEGVTDLSTKTTEGDEFVYNKDQNEYVVPQAWADKDVFILVKYKPSAEFEAMKSTGAADAKWVNIMNVENGNMMRYTRSGNVTGESRDSLNDVTNDYLWAIEGDPYGFKLHNRYADHGFDGTQNEKWSTLLTTDKVNSTEYFNYRSGVSDGNVNFTYKDNGDPVIKSGITYGTKGTSDAFGTMSETPTNAVYEAMTGNYDKGMIIHPVNGCINIKDQNGYKYFGAYLFNGAPTGDPVQLNYMQDWEVMRNVYANWQFVKPAAKQFLPYYNRAGFVGGLKTDVAADADNKAIFEKIAAGTTLNNEEYNAVWSLVQDPNNLVQFKSGALYRLKAYSAGNGVVGGDYVSGYLHKTELDDKKPLHIYGKAGVASNISSLLSYEGNEWAADVANKSLLEIPDIEFDPSSIFRVTRDGEGYVKMETQGLVVSDSKMMAEPDDPTTEQTESMLFQMQDIGLGAFQMRTKASATAATPVETAYLSCNPNTLKYGLNTEAKELNIASGVSSGATVKTHDTKWLLEPVGTTAENSAGNTYQRPLKVKVSAMSDGYSYSTLCLPFNYTLGEGIIAQKGTITGGVTAENGPHFHGTFELSDVEGTVKAGEPVVIKALSTAVTGGYVEVLLANEAPTLAEENLLIKGVSLTQELDELDELDDSKKKVFTLGSNRGKPQFRVNAVKDYTNVANNLFVNHNKIFLVLTNEQADALARGLSVVVDYDIDEEITTSISETSTTGRNDEGTIYDLSGRKVTRITQPGVYIRNGKKFVVRRGQY